MCEYKEGEACTIDGDDCMVEDGYACRKRVAYKANESQGTPEAVVPLNNLLYAHVLKRQPRLLRNILAC